MLFMQDGGLGWCASCLLQPVRRWSGVLFSAIFPYQRTGFHFNCHDPVLRADAVDQSWICGLCKADGTEPRSALARHDPRANSSSGSETGDDDSNEGDDNHEALEPALPKKRRGRPPKNQACCALLSY